MSVYLSILRTPGVALVVISTLFGRMPVGINGLAVLLYVEQITGSFGSAGLVTGVMALGSAVGLPLQGRLVDRRGTGVLIPLASAHAAGLACIWLLGELTAPVGLLAAAAAVAGALTPPASSVLRARWPYLLEGDPRLIAGAYALDSVLIEVIFVAGPLVTAVVVATVGPAMALAVSAACAVGGTVAFVAGLAGRPGPPPDRRRPAFGLGPLASPALRTLVVVSLPVGYCLGSIEVAIPAFSEAEGEPALAGVLLAIWSGSSGLAGLLYGARRTSAPLAYQHLVFTFLLPLACLPLALAGSPWAMVPLAILAGLPIAPLIASRNQLVGLVAPQGTAAEAFTWPLTAMVCGISIGAAASGSLADAHGWAVPVLAGAVLAAAGAAVLALQRHRLETRSATA